jgi:uncharacterized membrane protein
MSLMILGLVLFLGVHALTVGRAGRAALIGRIGHMPYKLAYSAVSIAGLVMMVQGFASYRWGGMIPVWDPPVAMRHVALLVMLPVFPLLLAAYLPGRIKATVKHPMILAVKTWALAHLLSNGDLGSMVLFGGFLAWAVVAFASMRRRSAGNQPLVPELAARPVNDIIAVVGGLALYALMIFGLHRTLIGVGVMG